MSRRPVSEPVQSPDEEQDASPRAARTSRAVDSASSMVVRTHGPIAPLLGLGGLGGAPGRLILGLPRSRGIPSIDVIEFTAPCPGCGREVMWIEEREETRLHIAIECRCAG